MPLRPPSRLWGERCRHASGLRASRRGNVAVLIVLIVPIVVGVVFIVVDGGVGFDQRPSPAFGRERVVGAVPLRVGVPALLGGTARSGTPKLTRTCASAVDEMAACH